MAEPTTENLTEAKNAANTALAPASFDFGEAVMDRNYPEFEVPVYLDEKLAQEWMDAYEQRYEFEQKMLNQKSPKPGAPITKARAADAEKMAELDTKFQEVTDRLKPEQYIIRIKGISPEKNVELEALANEQFPIQFEENPNPITGAIIKTPIENDKREAYYSSLIRQAHLVSVTAPNGAVDSDFSDLAKVQRVISNLPFLARTKVDEAINKATITVDFYRALADPVF